METRKNDKVANEQRLRLGAQKFRHTITPSETAFTSEPFIGLSTAGEGQLTSKGKEKESKRLYTTSMPIVTSLEWNEFTVHIMALNAQTALHQLPHTTHKYEKFFMVLQII